MTAKEKCGKKWTYFHCFLCLGVLLQIILISIITLLNIFSSTFVMFFFYFQDTFGEWYRYFLFSVWVIDIVLIFLVYHLETCLKEITENYQRDRCQEEDYVNYGANSFTCEQASWSSNWTIHVQLPSCKNDSSKKELMRCNGVFQYRPISLNEFMFTTFKCIFCAAICSKFE